MQFSVQKHRDVHVEFGEANLLVVRVEAELINFLLLQRFLPRFFLGGRVQAGVGAEYGEISVVAFLTFHYSLALYSQKRIFFYKL